MVAFMISMATSRRPSPGRSVLGDRRSLDGAAIISDSQVRFGSDAMRSSHPWVLMRKLAALLIFQPSLMVDSLVAFRGVRKSNRSHLRDHSAEKNQFSLQDEKYVG